MEHPEANAYKELMDNMEFHEAKIYEADDQKVVLVDIDETVCAYGEKRKYDLAIPIPKNIAKINKLYDEGNTIVYWTARGTTTNLNWFKVTQGQLEQWGCKYSELRMGKPYYDLFVDDKNINSEQFFKE